MAAGNFVQMDGFGEKGTDEAMHCQMEFRIIPLDGFEEVADGYFSLQFLTDFTDKAARGHSSSSILPPGNYHQPCHSPYPRRVAKNLESLMIIAAMICETVIVILNYIPNYTWLP